MSSLPSSLGLIRLTALSVALFATNNQAVAQQDDVVVISEPRPLAAALLLFEKRCHCIVTYDDVDWRRDQVEPLPERQRPGQPPTLIPKRFTFAFKAPRELAFSGIDNIEHQLTELLDTFHTTANDPAFGEFVLLRSRHGFHVFPRNRAILDTPITFPAAHRSLAALINEISERVKSATGTSVLLATGPINFLLNTATERQAHNERARDVLSSSLAATNQQLSWQMLYDYRVRNYHLNIHSVP